MTTLVAALATITCFARKQKPLIIKDVDVIVA